MNNDRLAEIQHRVTKQRVTFNDVTDLIQALRDERQKVAELQNSKNYWEECYNIALGHIREIETCYFKEHGYSFQYDNKKEGVKL